MAASRTPVGPKRPAAAAFKGSSHGSSAAAATSRARPPPLPRRPGRRPQQQQQQQQRYFGRMASNVTDHLKKVVPSHSFHPSLLPLPAPSFHRKASSISAYLECQVRPPPQPRRPYTAPDVYFGRRASNVTDHLRYIPPSHLGIDAQSKSLPYFGRLATSVTDASKYINAGDGDGVDNIACHWSSSRPGSARLPVPPQRVSKDILFHALSARGDHPCSGRRPTNIGSLLKHQFAQLHGDPSTHAELEHKMSFPNTIPQSLVPNCDDQVPAPEPHKFKNSNGAAFCSPRPANKRVDEDISHEAATKCGQISARVAAQRPGTAPPAAESTTKRTHQSNTNHMHQHLPSPRMAGSPRPPASPRPASARCSVASEKRVLKRMGELAASPRRKLGNEDQTVNAKDEEELCQAQITNEDQEMMTESGQRMVPSGGEGGRQSAQGEESWWEGSDEGDGASEKLELVRQWVEQEEQGPQKRHPAAAWPPKPLDHSRRATSITKYNIW